MALEAYQELLRLIVDGDNVDAATINTVLRQLRGNTSYLKEIFEAAALGSTVYARGVTIEADAAVGMPVYFHLGRQRFERGLARAYVDHGQLRTADSTQIWGIVANKLNATLADLLLVGYAAIDIAAAVNGDVTAGVYYLSGTAAGKLTQQRPPLSVAVLQSDGLGNVFVRTSLADLFTSHQHYKFELVCRPAGQVVPPAIDERHAITSPDASLEGWLPANHASFAGHAPPGAAFGYNLAASEVQNAWPPLPSSGAYLEWDKGEVKDLAGMGVPLGTDGLCVIDNYGIWWKSDCYGDVPWPTQLDTSDASVAESSSLSLECPRELQMRLTLWFTKMQFQTADTVVTSLRTPAGSLLSITCTQDGTPATSGDLTINLSLDLAVISRDATGHLALKNFTSGKFTRGPMVEGLIAGSSNILLDSTAQAGNLHQGEVTLVVLNRIPGNELPIETVRLSGVTEENHLDTLALGFPADKDSEYRAKFVMPAELDGVTSLTVALRLWLLARAAGDLPDLTMTVRVVPRPSPATTPIAVPTSDSALAFDTQGLTVSEDQYVEIQSGSFDVAPGDVVFFTVTRSANGGDGFSDELHVLDQRAIILTANA